MELPTGIEPIYDDYKSTASPLMLREHFNKTHSVTEFRVKHSTYQHLLSNPAEPDQGRMCFIKGGDITDFYCTINQSVSPDL